MSYERQIVSHLKRMGRHEQWSRYLIGNGYASSKTIGNYKVDYDEDESDMRILLWNPARPCMIMAIDKRSKTAAINKLEYNADGTRKMVQFALDLLKQHGVTSVSLMDDSTVECEGHPLELAPMYFLKYGVTWYEKYFGFKPASRFTKSYESAKRLRKERFDTDMLSKQPCTFFTDEVVNDFFQQIGLVDFYKYEWIKEL